MGKWMAEFRRKSQSRVIKIARVNSIRMTKSINLLEFFVYHSSRWRHRESSFSDEAICYHSTMVLSIKIYSNLQNKTERLNITLKSFRDTAQHTADITAYSRHHSRQQTSQQTADITADSRHHSRQQTTQHTADTTITVRLVACLTPC